MFDFDGVLLDSYDAAYKIMRSEDPTLTEEKYHKFFKVIEASEQLPIVPQISEVITDAVARQYKLCIISSSGRKIIETFLELHGLSKYFSQILGYEDGASKVEKMETIINENQLTRDACLYITDTMGDIEAARIVGVASVAVTWGFQTEQELQTAKPNFLVKKPSQILPVAAGYFSVLSK